MKSGCFGGCSFFVHLFKICCICILIINFIKKCRDAFESIIVNKWKLKQSQFMLVI